MTRAGDPNNETCFMKMFDGVLLEFGFKSIDDDAQLLMKEGSKCSPLVEINTQKPMFYSYGIIELNNDQISKETDFI